MPVAEFAFPGPLRDQLVAAIVDGAKTTTTGLVADYEHEGEPLPRPGERRLVIDSAGQPVTVIETVAVRVLRLADVDLAHAIGEGEGYTSVAQWRAGHEGFWHSDQMREALDDPGFTVDDDTLVVAEEFRIVGREPQEREPEELHEQAAGVQRLVVRQVVVQVRAEHRIPRYVHASPASGAREPAACRHVPVPAAGQLPFRQFGRNPPGTQEYAQARSGVTRIATRYSLSYHSGDWPMCSIVGRYLSSRPGNRDGGGAPGTTAARP